MTWPFLGVMEPALGPRAFPLALGTCLPLLDAGVTLDVHGGAGEV